jgi:hypothetical protein
MHSLELPSTLLRPKSTTAQYNESAEDTFFKLLVNFIHTFFLEVHTGQTVINEDGCSAKHHIWRITNAF